MNHYLRYCLLLILLPITGFCASIVNKDNYWQCFAQDSTGKQWMAKHSYQKTAFNLAFATCKKQSRNPRSCKSSAADCEGFLQGNSTKPKWRCTALDQKAVPWRSNFYTQRLDAAFAAKAFCRENSTVPDTCYINLVTCRNLNEPQ